MLVFWTVYISLSLFLSFSVQNTDGYDMRVEPVGKDSEGNHYWYFIGSQLYRESAEHYKKCTTGQRDVGGAGRGGGRGGQSARSSRKRGGKGRGKRNAKEKETAEENADDDGEKTEEM